MNKDPYVRADTAVPLELLYRDDSILVIDKPEGLGVHRSRLVRSSDTLVQRLRDQFNIEPYLVHRLDQPTSGIMIISTNSDSARFMGGSFREGRVRKKYLCVVRGFTAEEGLIDLPMKTALKGKEGPERETLTEFKRHAVVELAIANDRYPGSRYSLVEANPLTGRYHQIRRHLARTAHPIIGDTTHGDLLHNQIFRDNFNCSRLLLHAASITFPHPESGIEMRITSPLKGEFLRVVRLLGWVDPFGCRLGRSD